MVRRRVLLFAGLVMTQIAHSTEEYIGRLWEVLPPARFISSLFASDLARGFLVFNVLVIALGLFCLIGPVARDWPAGRAVAWGWSLAELANGVGHLLLPLAQGDYVPGLVTAPALIVFALLVMHDLRRVARAV
jgi:hypothetical protein